ncbi:SDR family oxidoreductase [Saccharopolyspora sp. ASAGF58]|uniref:SDR family oxidoreductase n=1 Tax=Saccharopolyspora TaxID=1835 RepID=UPI00143FD852|nr:SDR family oxidoreductase [Saccharopolyspora sp. ASAGF58]QIZ38720.1 SDR family oxidoreductase [Saccharopolyspora sp. ASAGF58]
MSERRVAVVTGAARGIGAAVVRRLSRAGWSVVAVDRCTDMLCATAKLYGLADPEELAQHQLVRRLLAPEEVAEAVAWVCSPESAAVTGSVVHADGGFAG